jgi:hypothetical protein
VTVGWASARSDDRVAVWEAAVTTWLLPCGLGPLGRSSVSALVGSWVHPGVIRVGRSGDVVAASRAKDEHISDDTGQVTGRGPKDAEPHWG